MRMCLRSNVTSNSSFLALDPPHVSGGVARALCGLICPIHRQETTMQAAAREPGRPPSANELDEDTLAFVRRVFGFARAGDSAELAPLLAQGLPANLRNERGDSLLMLACYHGHPDAARLLLEHGADPEIMNDAGQAPLHGAAFKGDLATATLLLERGARVDAAGPNGKTALLFAAMFNRVDIARLLLAHGADPLRRDADGNAILDAARKMGASDTAALLAALTKET
jgi:ankyrin repeat protein